MTAAKNASRNIAMLYSSAEKAKPISSREKTVLRGLLEGMTDGEIAAVLGVSEKTVNYYMRQLGAKLGARNRTHVVIQALRMQLVSLD